MKLASRCYPPNPLYNPLFAFDELLLWHVHRTVLISEAILDSGRNGDQFICGREWCTKTKTYKIAQTRFVLYGCQTQQDLFHLFYFL